MNFVGDIMMGRRYESPDGIITIQGVNTLFEPTYEILGNSADITIANLFKNCAIFLVLVLANQFKNK